MITDERMINLLTTGYNRRQTQNITDCAKAPPLLTACDTFLQTIFSCLYRLSKFEGMKIGAEYLMVYNSQFKSLREFQNLIQKAEATLQADIEAFDVDSNPEEFVTVVTDLIRVVNAKLKLLSSEPNPLEDKNPALGFSRLNSLLRVQNYLKKIELPENSTKPSVAARLLLLQKLGFFTHCTSHYHTANAVQEVLAALFSCHPKRVLEVYEVLDKEWHPETRFGKIQEKALKSIQHLLPGHEPRRGRPPKK